jgi:hypothetical protein
MTPTSLLLRSPLLPARLRHWDSLIPHSPGRRRHPPPHADAATTPHLARQDSAAPRNAASFPCHHTLPSPRQHPRIYCRPCSGQGSANGQGCPQRDTAVSVTRVRIRVGTRTVLPPSPSAAGSMRFKGPMVRCKW